MIRLIGLLTGAVGMMALITFVTGPPELHGAGANAATAVTSVAAPAPIPASDPGARSSAPQPESAAATTSQRTDAGRRAAPFEVGPPLSAATGADPAGAGPADSATALPSAATPASRPDANAKWHSFWNPFRSEIAANGFASRLRSVTGIDYRVVRLEPGSYQVAFAYADDAERRSKISQIESATGLNLPEESR